MRIEIVEAGAKIFPQDSAEEGHLKSALGLQKDGDVAEIIMRDNSPQAGFARKSDGFHLEMRRRGK